MERYIGLDVHAASTTFAVVSATGKRLGSRVVETTGQALIEQLRSIAGWRHVCLEQGTQSAWLYGILSPHAEQVVVAMVSERRGQKNDEGVPVRPKHGAACAVTRGGNWRAANRSRRKTYPTFHPTRQSSPAVPAA